MPKTLKMKKLYFIILLCSITFSISIAQTSEVEKIVQANLDAYNNHDIDLFMSFFDKNIVLKNFQDQKITAQGIEAVRAIYEPYFKASPQLHSKILNRMVFDNKVIDYEYITGARGNTEPFQIIMIYEVINNKITTMTAIRQRPNN